MTKSHFVIRHRFSVERNLPAEWVADLADHAVLEDERDRLQPIETVDALQWVDGDPLAALDEDGARQSQAKTAEARRYYPKITIRLVSLYSV